MSKTKHLFKEIRKEYAQFWSKYYYFRKSMMWMLHHIDRLDEKKQAFIEKVYSPLQQHYDALPDSTQEDLDPLMCVADIFVKTIQDPILEALKDTQSWAKLCQVAEKKAKEQEDDRLTLPSSKESN